MTEERYRPVDDRLLNEHYVRPSMFDIGGQLTPISICNQMYRAQEIIDRAKNRKSPYINSTDRPLLVVGAGAAGVCAAIYAAWHGIDTTLIERERAPFSRQRYCQSRWLDPTQYDWPATHWQNGCYPKDCDGSQVPLPWKSNTANLVAVDWARRFNRERRILPNLHIKYKTEIDGLTATDERSDSECYVQVHLKRTRRGRTYIEAARSFGMVLLCVGFGAEDCAVDDFHSYQFWDTDDYLSPRPAGLEREKLKVLISGGGDGALQDFLRLVTQKRSARDIYEAVRSVSEPQWSEMESRLMTAEINARAEFQWTSPESDHDHRVLQQINDFYIRELANLQNANGGAIWERVFNVLNDLIGVPPRIVWTHPCTHLGNCYGLNRLLTLLISDFLKAKWPDKILVMEGTKVVSVVPVAPHVCKSNASLCHGQSHTVRIVAKQCGQEKPLSNPTLSGEQFDIIVVRHGVEKTEHLPGTSKALRQVLPFYSQF